MTGVLEETRIPREALAEALWDDIARRREPGASIWLAVHGAPGTGKRDLATALVKAAESEHRIIVRRTLGDGHDRLGVTVAKDDVIVPFAEALGVANPDMEGFRAASNELFGFASVLVDALNRVARTSGGVPLLVIEQAELLLAQPDIIGTLGAAFGGATAPAFDLVTTADFPLYVLAGGRRAPKAIREVALANYALPRDEFDRALDIDPGNAPDAAIAVDDEGPSTKINHLDSWLQAATAKTTPFLRKLSSDRPSAIDRIRDQAVIAAGGHPFLTVELLGQIYRSAKAGTEVRNIIESAKEGWRDQPDALRARLLPLLSGTRRYSASLSETIVSAVDSHLAATDPARAGESPHPERLLTETRRGLGLPPPGAAPSPIAWLAGRDWLLHQREALRQHLVQVRSDAHARQVDDPELQRIEEKVRAYFCDSELGRSRRYRLLDGRSTRIATAAGARQYRFELHSNAVPRTAEPANTGKGETARPAGTGKKASHVPHDPVARFETLHVFSGLRDPSKRLWLGQVALLRRLSTVRCPALTRVYHAGTLEDDGLEDVEMGERAWIGYVAVDEAGQQLARSPEVRGRLLERRRLSGFDTEEPPLVVGQVVALSEALKLLHDQGILHRRINPSSIGVRGSGDAPELVLSGYEFAMLLRTAAGGMGRISQPNAVSSAQDLCFLPPEVLRESGGQTGAWEAQRWTHSDIYAFGVLLAWLLTGPPTEAQVEALCAGIDTPQPDTRPDARGPAVAAFAAALHDRERWKSMRGQAWQQYLDEVREVVRRCLDTEFLNRPSAKWVHGRLKLAMAQVSRELRYGTDEYLVVYDSKHMGANLGKLFPEKFEGETDTPDAQARVRAKIFEWLCEASEIVYSPDGFTGAKFADATNASGSVYTILGPDVVFYARLQHRLDGIEEPRMLRLNFTVRTTRIGKRHVPESLRVPFPPKFRVMGSWEIDHEDRDGSVARSPSWTPILKRVDKQKEEFKGAHRLAAATWQLHSAIEVAAQKLRNMPVYASLEGAEVELRLNETRFLDQIKDDPAMDLMFNRQDPVGFFVDTLDAWREQASAGAAKVQFITREEDGYRRFDITILEVGSRVARVTSGRYDTTFSKSGSLFFTDQLGTNVAAARQIDAVRQLLGNTDLFDYLVVPRSGAPVYLPADSSLGSKSAFGEDTYRVLSNIKSGVPISALQGPPGTGKTTVLALAVEELLADDPSLRILVTSQSHAAVDTSLKRIADRLDPDLGYRLIRLVPSWNPDRVSEAVIEKYESGRHTEDVKRHMKQQAEAARREPPAGANRVLFHAAAARLGEAAKRSGHEIRRRIERSAPVTACTTSAASQAADLLRGDIRHFDVVIVDEAAKAWGVDIVQPLAIANRAILVGDQQQLPPFNIEVVSRAFDRGESLARGGATETMTDEMRLVFDQDNAETAREWLEPFERLFLRCPVGEASNADRSKVPVTQRLGTQYRSLGPIGDLVSQTFYDGKLKTADHLRDPLPVEPILRLGNIEHDPVLCWVDTSGMTDPRFRTNPDRSRGFRNRGEADLILSMLGRMLGAFRRDLGPSVAPEEKLRVLSPYKGQVEYLKTEILRKARPGSRESSRLWTGMETAVQTIDSAQGAEADLVIVSLVRSETNLRFPPETAAISDWESKINQGFGFLQSPERINVMLSRARRQLVIVGDRRFFGQFPLLVQGLEKSSASRPEGSTKPLKPLRFWEKLLAHFPQDESGEAGARVVDAALLTGIAP